MERILPNLAALADVRELENDTFEIEDINEVGINAAASCSSTSSCSSCCSSTSTSK